MAKDIAARLNWPASAAAGTVREAVGDEGRHVPDPAMVLIHNPSTVTALAVSCRIRFADTGGVARDAVLTTFTVAVNSTVATRVEGLGMGRPIVRLSNNTATGVGQGFDAEVRVEVLGG